MAVYFVHLGKQLKQDYIVDSEYFKGTEQGFGMSICIFFGT